MLFYIWLLYSISEPKNYIIDLPKKKKKKRTESHCLFYLYLVLSHP